MNGIVTKNGHLYAKQYFHGYTNRMKVELLADNGDIHQLDIYFIY